MSLIQSFDLTSHIASKKAKDAVYTLILSASGNKLLISRLAAYMVL